MTTITSSLISLEGKNINILRGLPIEEKTILMSKVYACLCITTPALLVGDIILFITFKTRFIEALLLILLSILAPLVSHFIGLIVNLKYPKLDAENSTEVVKQSASSLVSVTIGMALMIISFIIITNFIGSVSPLLILGLCIIAFLLIDILLYIFLTTWGVKKFNKLSI
jgi:ABC-2 type transport system permease protein